MSLKHAILGFLSYAPLSGYDLKKAFDQSVRHFWPADQSQIYRTLAQLAADGLAMPEVIAREERLDRKVYHLTDAGRAELHRWLTSPLPPADTREPFLIQVFFAGNLSDDEALALLEGERALIAGQLAEFEALFDHLAAQPVPDDQARLFFFTMLTLERTIALGRPYLAWLDGAIDRARRGDYTPTLPHLLTEE
jgi:DNA-binding PadR family transcriptional regulator